MRLSNQSAVALAVVIILLPSVCAFAAGEPLRVSAERRGFHVGAAVDTGPLAREARYATTLAREFNACVAENVFKFGPIHPERDRYDFAAADALATFARARGMRLRGHTLVWHRQLAAWVTGGSFTREEAIAVLRDHIREVAGRYRGRVWAWDVVNEAIADDGSGLRKESFWYEAIGPDYVALAFRFAREADPDALLYYNDYGAEGLGPKSDAVYALVRDLKAAGVPVDGVGWQMHVWGGFRISDEHRANARRLAELGLRLSMTELDVRVQLPATPEKLAAQAETYRDVASFCVSEPAFEALVLWGFTDKYSWIPGFAPGFGAALPFDERYRPKPAYEALSAALAAGGGTGPVLSFALRSNKKLAVWGGGFAEGAVVLVNGAAARTAFVSATKLAAKRVGLTIRAGDEVQVRAVDGTLSNAFVYGE